MHCTTTVRHMLEGGGQGVGGGGETDTDHV
jgi:hypothetical protein